jgi:hypothetical protein
VTPPKQPEPGQDLRASADPGESPTATEAPAAAEAPRTEAAAGPGAPAAEPTRAAKPVARYLRMAAPWLVVCCYLIGAVAVTARLWADPAGRAQLGDPGDVDLYVWFLGYAATAVSHGHLPALVTAAMNAPQGINVMWNTSFLLPGVVFAPVTLLAGPQVSLTVILTLGFAGSAASLFWVLRRWGATISAAALGGAVYGFSPALLTAGTGHFQLQFVVLPPLIADAVLRLITGRGRSVLVGLWLGLLCAAQLFIGEEILVYTAVAAVALTVAVAASRPREVLRRARGAATGLAVAVAVFLLADWHALHVQFAGPLAEHSKLLGSLGSDPGWFVTPSASLLFHTRASAAAAATAMHVPAEYVSYLGWPLIGVLVIAAAVFWRDVRVRVAVVTWAVLEWFAFGAGDVHFGDFTWPAQLLPWHWLEGLPGLAQVLPWRFAILADGAAAAALAFSLDRARAAVPQAKRWRAWARGAIIVVALLAALPLLPLPYPAASVPPVPAGWQATFARLRLAPDSPVLVLPFPSAFHPEVLRWQADTGQPGSLIGGYFLGPGATGQASFYFETRSPQTEVAGYLFDLWQGQHPQGLPGAEIRSVIRSWRLAAVVVVTGQPSALIHVLTGLFGRPAFHIGGVLSWLLRR